VSHYTLASEGFYAEFLAPLHGSGVKRSGQPDATVARAGVTAQKLRHLDLLLLAPLSVRIGEEAGFPLPSPAAVRVPNPVSFIAQKLLIQHDRLPEKRPQDLLYIHDTLELFARRLPELASLWTGTLRPMLARTVAKRIEQHAAEDFRSLSHEMESAARIPVDRAIRPERLRATCAYGLSVIFGR